MITLTLNAEQVAALEYALHVAMHKIQREPHTCEMNKQADHALLHQLGTIGMDLYVEAERAALGLAA